MPLPTLNTLDLSTEIDDYIHIKLGLFELWFAHCDGGDSLIAFESPDEPGKTCVNPLDSWNDDLKEMTLKFPGRRCARTLDYADFVAVWERQSNPYLHPKKKGKIRIDLPLNADTPLDILADWLQDKGCEQAAIVLRASLTESNPEENKSENIPATS